MVIKDNFELMNKTPNLLSVPSSSLQSYEQEENSPRHIFTFLTLKQKNIKHFAKDKIFKFIGDVNKREKVRVVNFEKYPLSVTMNRPTKDVVINLKPFDVEDIASLNPNDLYAVLAYGYGFSRLITGKVKIGDMYAKPIIDFLTSMFVRVFGKEYGLTEIYSTGIPKLKFLLSCYIFASFFGQANDASLLRKASSTAPYNYQDEMRQILSYDYSSITQFLKALSDLKVMPGVKPYSFTTKIYRYFGINMLAALEDPSRFLMAIVCASIGGSKVVPTFISTKYNERAFSQLIDLIRKVYR
jgi:hypothetical protein